VTLVAVLALAGCGGNASPAATLLSGLFFEESADEATAKSPIQTQVDKMEAQILALRAKLGGALNTLSGTTGASPTP
jgi:hypothetical protein